MSNLLLDRSRHQGPEEVQLSITETNAAGTLGMTFSPERTAHHCESHPLRDPTGARLSSDSCSCLEIHSQWKGSACEIEKSFP